MPTFPLSVVPLQEFCEPAGAIQPADADGICLGQQAEFTLTLPSGGPVAISDEGRRRASGIILDFYRTHFDGSYPDDVDLQVTVNSRPMHRILLEPNAPFSAIVIGADQLGESDNQIEIRPSTGSKPPAAGEWRVRGFAFNRSELWPAICARMIWMYGSARSGTTWLANMMCQADGVLPMDETGLGRMLGVHKWQPERSFPMNKSFYRAWQTEPELSGGSFMRLNPPPLRPFQRHLTEWAKQPQFLSNPRAEDLMVDAVRDLAVKHALKEWGIGFVTTWVLKCPNDTQAADMISAWLPESGLLFAVRDGRDSLKSRFSAFASGILSKTRDEDLRKHAITLYSHFWNFQIDIARHAFEAHPPERRMQIRYEDLRVQPKELFWEVASTFQLGLTREAADAIVEQMDIDKVPESEKGADRPIQQGKIGGYQEQFTQKEVQLMTRIMAPNLKAFGYK